MEDIDERRVTLPSDLAAAVDKVVATGEFASVGKVVEAALRDWNERRDHFGYSLNELRVLIQQGIDSGPGHFSSMDEIKAEARRRFGQRALSA